MFSQPAQSLTFASRPHRTLVAACLMLCLGFLPSPAIGGQEKTKPDHNWAILIGAEKYEFVPQLRYTNNDVRQLASTLRGRGDVSEAHLLEVIDSESREVFRPTHASLRKILPFWLRKPGENDRVVLYFSGHGFRDRDGKLYLAPIDYDPGDPAGTGISVDWLRSELSTCRAKVKILILDACHAGAEKGGEVDLPTVNSDELAGMFRDTSNVITLASSTGDQKSQLWGEKQQSLFSYWLNQGLKGHADRDGDAVVNIDELYSYLHRNVTYTAKNRLGREQTPVRIVRAGSPGTPAVIRLAPQSLRQVISDMAEQISWAIEERKISKLGVLEFTNDTKLGELLGADFGLLGRYCAAELERELMQRGLGKFSVVDQRRLQGALRSQAFDVQDLGSPDALRKLSHSAGGLSGIAVGTLRNRAGRIITLECKLVMPSKDELGASVGGTAYLSESEWAMLGNSAAVHPEDRRPMRATASHRIYPASTRVIKHVDRRAQGGHPQLDTNFPFRVRIMVNRKERKPYFEGNKMYIGLSKGETYEIYVENRSGQVVLARILVDGLNTLVQKAPLKGVAMNQIGRPIVNLDEARAWVLDPNRENTFRLKGVPTWAVRGFVKTTGVNGKLDEFLVVDARSSFAARQNFTEQIGLITAAFYAPKGTTRGAIGTDRGKEREEDIRKYHVKTEAGNLLGVVHVYYRDRDSLQASKR